MSSMQMFMNPKTCITNSFLPHFNLVEEEGEQGAAEDIRHRNPDSR